MTTELKNNTPILLDRTISIIHQSGESNFHKLQKPFINTDLIQYYTPKWLLFYYCIKKFPHCIAQWGN